MPNRDLETSPAFDTVHAPVAYWAARTPDAVAIDDGSVRLTFEDLLEGAPTDVEGVNSSPTPIWVDDASSPAAQLLSLVRIVAAGNAAAVGDPDWSPVLRRQVMEGLRPSPLGEASTSILPQGSFYVGFTSGSTGMPKGFVRSHKSWANSFEVCIETFGAAAHGTVLAPGRLSHSLFLFGSLLGLRTGAGVRLQARFSAVAALQTLTKGDAQTLIAVPSQLMLMLEQAHRQRFPPIEGTRLVMIGGAPWQRTRTPQLQALFPNARIIEFYGASETSFVAWTDSHIDLPASAVGRPFQNVQLQVKRIAVGGSDSAASLLEPGLIYVRSPMVFSDYAVLGGAARPTILRDGEWICVGDMGHVDADGVLHLAGRQQRMLLVQGKNLFPEEVEQVLLEHPCVSAASIVGVPDDVRGMRPVAVVELLNSVDRATLTDWCRVRLEPFKVPRRMYASSYWPRTPSGKTDHAALAGLLAFHPEGPPGWKVLPWRTGCK
ncbi:MAG: AMP-binding protein [Proteobacteria bacterium]|nr:AMP-binding protein [Pseudomonadota bacterium]